MHLSGTQKGFGKLIDERTVIAALAFVIGVLLIYVGLYVAIHDKLPRITP